jgi:hypothetical protein
VNAADLIVSPNDIAMNPGDTRYVGIISGNGLYQVSRPSISVSAQIS